MNEKILVVEDDVAFGAMLNAWFERNGYHSLLCSTLSSAKQALTKNTVHLVLSDLRLPDGDGIMLLQWIKEQNMTTPVVIMTSYAEVQSAVSAIKLGAEDYLEKPIVPAILKEKIAQGLAKYQEVSSKSKEAVKPQSPKAQKRSEAFIIGSSAMARQVYDHILKVSPTKMSVLILGESGTGKEYAAKMIHDLSPRREKPFIAVDCGSLSKELAPSELFGHIKGSFTSAIDNKTGVFELASGGTVLLDEVGNLHYDVQSQLLRTLQEQKVRSVGAVTDAPVDVRIIAATNDNLELAIAQGRFREDLYHRLNEFSLFIPPLRERADDIKLFATAFLKQANEELERNIEGFAPPTIALLKKHHWSGNLRELRNAIRRAALFATGNEILPNDLPPLHEATPEDAGLRKEGGLNVRTGRYNPLSEDFALRPGNEKEQIEAALHKARGNKTLAAQLLQIDRKTLYNKMRGLGVTR